MEKRSSYRGCACRVALLLLFLAGHSWGAVTFSVTSLPRVVRAQGITEPIGEIILTATSAGTTTGDTIVIIRLLPSVAITNNRSVLPSPISVVGTKAPAVVLASVGGDSVTLSVAGGTSFQVGDDFRVRGIRVNASAAGVAFPPGITAEVGAFPGTEILLTNAMATVAVPEPALATTGTAATGIVPAAAPVLQCAPDRTPAGTGVVTVAAPGDIPSGSTVFRAVVTENFSTGFTTASGFVSGDERTATSTAEVTNATRLLVRATNLPAGMTVFAPGAVDAALGGTPATSAGLLLTLVLGADANGAGGSLVTSTTEARNTAFHRFAPSQGSVTIVYEVRQASASMAETANIPIAVTTAHTPNGGRVTASLALGPVSTAGGSSSTDPIPRFVDQSITGAALRVIPCSSNLLFSWVTNQADFDTGLAISNTSKDPYGTAPQSGTITLHFFGVNAPAAPITTSAVAAGATYTAVLSSIAPGFQGYIIAVANFQFASGFAFLSNGFGQPGGPAIATSYTATDIPDPAILGSRSAPGVP